MNASAAAPAATFVSTVGLEDKGPFNTFKEALADFITRMKEMTEKGTSLQAIETTCWIERKSAGSEVPLLFYDARDFAYAVGLMKLSNDGEGELVSDAEEPPTKFLDMVYAASFPGGPTELVIGNIKELAAGASPASA